MASSTSKSTNTGFASRLSSDDSETISEINITPLVDVVLVLLIIFMITAPAIYQSAIKVELPKATTGEANEKSALSFTLSASGETFWNGKSVNWSTFGSELLALHAKSDQETAVIGADEKTPHGAVVKLMDALRQAGFNRFAMSVDQSPKN